ncbi:tRNA pseudouridine38-40 synthase [Geothermobacter ehrlichii]|uniref:tRNA pseudouridine synthase A n=1 Tax=Geothermobacter ehrlichii TaxID=213224 RepID=A0A5D3WNA5_9BACT|nr:tRNA pseudouridine(38-40) synthase TruA [Geothermobacter ehrlichii]TYO99548.1 tRNA pseudouridine38-40 synthase [Geothermobacter ehrlichii]
MTCIRLTLEYDGTDFAGWQVQPNGRTVQEELERALSRLLKEEVRVHASGRTDAGVHAREQVVHFHTGKKLPLKAYVEGLRALLPRDLAVVGASEAGEGFHARFSARGKWYRYRILRTGVPHPLQARYCWQLAGPLEVADMRRAAERFVGEHDFAAFCAAGSDVRTTVRRIDACELREDGDLLLFDVRGSGFLRNMVRIMVGTLVEIGQGKRQPESIDRLLASGRREDAGKTAPPQGLCLMRVFY